MNIACLGWGSLIWDPRELLIEDKWHEDGPMLPVELTRQSQDKRITFIIDEQAEPIQVLWSKMTVKDLNHARLSLKDREGAYRLEDIHFIKVTEQQTEGLVGIIKQWLESKQLDAAIWTGLTYSKSTNYARPSIDYVLNHLKSLESPQQKNAEEYIRKAPRQILTEYRLMIEENLGWKRPE